MHWRKNCSVCSRNPILLERRIQLRSSMREVQKAKLGQTVEGYKYQGEEFGCYRKGIEIDILITYFVPKFGIGKNLAELARVFSMQCQLQHTGLGTCPRLASRCLYCLGTQIGLLLGVVVPLFVGLSIWWWLGSKRKYFQAKGSRSCQSFI